MTRDELEWKAEMYERLHANSKLWQAYKDGYFYVFDIQNGANGNWWNREALETFVNTYNDKSRVDIVPIMLTGTIDAAVDFVKTSKEFYTGKRAKPSSLLRCFFEVLHGI